MSLFRQVVTVIPDLFSLSSAQFSVEGNKMRE